ncbi:hypothetical protein DYB35_007452 [Aphanomyces astaci]|uniref:Peptidase M14 domain-containing protein n=1 Tax=Aphanomyces astaci TaxID=112090 RepID=A0A3R7EG17_APHAT|nr:hypothetical protein DYB35_007452 [Aphanomyces astaci]
MKYSLLSVIALFAAAATAQTNNAIAVIDNRVRSLHEVSEPEGDADVNATAKVYQGDEDIDANRACQEQNTNYIPSLKAGQYSTSAFHNCFRTIDQIVEFTDALAAQNPTLLTRFAISKTYWNNTIYGYKLSKDKGHSQSLYFQAQLHAREWTAVSSILFSLASILDDIANKKPTAADEYDLYFVPIVNVDGYIQHMDALRQAMEDMHRDVAARSEKLRQQARGRREKKAHVRLAKFALGDFVLLGKIIKFPNKLALNWKG